MAGRSCCGSSGTEPPSWWTSPGRGSRCPPPVCRLGTFQPPTCQTSPEDPHRSQTRSPVIHCTDPSPLRSLRSKGTWRTRIYLLGKRGIFRPGGSLRVLADFFSSSEQWHILLFLVEWQLKMVARISFMKTETKTKLLRTQLVKQNSTWSFHI